MSATPQVLLGRQAEDDVARILREQGFRILDRNWRRAWGELDIVARRGDTIHFVEVKASRTRTMGFEPTVRAGNGKMAKVARTARSWLLAHGFSADTDWQMDVASVIMDEPERKIELFENI